MTWVLVFLGGGIGSLLRFGTGKLSHIVFPSNLVLGTFSANLLSCLILGVSLGMFKDKIESSSLLYFFLITGICGGFSTFSTFSLESIKLFQEGLYLYAAANILLSLGFCLLIIWYFLR